MRLSYLYIIIIASVMACNSKQLVEEKEERAASTYKISSKVATALNLQIGSLSEMELADEVQANGLIDIPPQNTASVTSPLGGYVKKAYFLPGNHVHKGDILAVMEHPNFIQLQQDYLENRSRLLFLEQELARQQELQEKKVGAARDLQQIQSEEQAAKGKNEALTARLQLLNISIKQLNTGKVTPTINLLAPLSGYITQVNATIGMSVTPELVLYRIVDKSHMHIELKVFEKDLHKVKEGQLVIFTVPDAGLSSMKAKVFLKGKVFENDTRAVGVHCHLESDYEDLLPGMYINAKIQSDKVKVKALSEDAFIREGDKYYVYQLVANNSEGSTFTKVEVVIGKKQDGFIEVKGPSGFLTSDRIVLKGTYHLNAELNKGQE